MTVLKDGSAPLKRITVAVDGSVESVKALEFMLTKFQAGRSIDQGGSVPIHVTVVHVMARRPVAPIEFRFSAPWIKSEKKVKGVARSLVEKCAQKLTKAGFTAESVFKIGNPAEEIIKVAAKQRTDLIVMGAKGLGTIDRVLLGSVSMQVLQYANCPVLIVR